MCSVRQTISQAPGTSVRCRGIAGSRVSRAPIPTRPAGARPAVSDSLSHAESALLRAVPEDSPGHQSAQNDDDHRDCQQGVYESTRLGGQAKYAIARMSGHEARPSLPPDFEKMEATGLVSTTKHSRWVMVWLVARGRQGDPQWR